MIRKKTLNLEEALRINKLLEANGSVPYDKIVLAVSNEDNKTKSGIILPGEDVEGIPKRGVIVQVNDSQLEEDTRLKIGTIITYGNYSGKEIEPNCIPDKLLRNYDLRVLSLTEISYYEKNEGQ